MKETRPKGIWVRSSSTPNRKERLQAHKEFEASDLKKMLDEGWEITTVKLEYFRTSPYIATI